MRISQVCRLRRRVAAVLIVPLLLWCVDAPALAQQQAPQENKAEAIVLSVEAKPNSIDIRYEFMVGATGSYVVSIDLLKTGDPSFRVPLRSISGDIGIVSSARGTREVHWNYLKDYPAGIGGDDYYFSITLNKVGSGGQAGGSNLWYYVGSGLVVIGSAVALLVIGKKAATSTELPSAPVRPTQ